MARAKHKTIKISAPTNASGAVLGMAAAQLEALYPESFPRGLPKLTKRTVTIPTDMLDMMSSELERQTDESFAYELSEELGVDYDEVLEAARDAEDALAAAGRQRNPPFSMDDFDGFADDDYEPPPSDAGLSEFRRMYGTEPMLIDPSEVLRDTKGVSRVYIVPPQRAWHVWVEDEGVDPQVLGQRLFRKLIPRSKIPAAVPALHKAPLLLGVGARGTFEISPPEKKKRARTAGPSVSDKKADVLDTARAFFGSKGASLGGRAGAYTLTVRPALKKHRGLFKESTVRAATLDELREQLDRAIEKIESALPQRNPLRARPPQSFHGLDMGGSQRFRRSVGRTMTDDDAAGVHTTGNFNIAAMYGAPTAKKTDSFVVVLELDTSGLEPLPDVDAMMEAADTLGDRGLRRSAEGMDLEEFNESCYEYGSESYISPGEDLWVAIFGEQVRGGMCQAFDSQADFERWVRTGEYTDAEAARVVDQQRYLHDFDFDRLIRVHVVQPWWPMIEWEDPVDDREEERFDTIQEAGYQIYTTEDALNGAQLASKAVAKGGSTAKRGEYHGTSAALALQAFPELGEISNPYEVMDLDQLERILDRLEENPAPRSRRRKARKLGPTMRKLLRGL